MLLQMTSLICPLCPVERTSQLNLNLKNFMKHIQLFHSHQPSFSITCGLGGCIRRFTNFQVFRNHVSVFHSGDPLLSNTAATTTTTVPDESSVPNRSSSDTDDGATGFDDVGDGYNSGASGIGTLGMNPDDLKMSSALFLLGLKEKHKLTQVSVEGVVTGVTSLVQSSLLQLQSQVSSYLLESGVSSDVITSLKPLFTSNGLVTNPFEGLETKHLQTNFYRTHFNLIVCTSIILPIFSVNHTGTSSYSTRGAPCVERKWIQATLC